MVIAGALLGVWLCVFGVVVAVVGSVGQGPGPAGVACAPSGGAASATSDLSERQLANAAAIVAAGVRLGMPVRGQVIAVAAALQESSLWRYANATVPASFTQPHDRVGHDHDSVGLFQQRGGWGPVATRMNPAASATLFYTALLAIPHWQDLPLTAAADLVQHSALPDAYAQWETPANQIVGAVTGVSCPTAGGAVAPPANPRAQEVITRALRQIGVPYVWGGGGPQGPTRGGFDCSGLMVYAYAGIGVTVPHQTQQIWRMFQLAIHRQADLQPGDMLLFGAGGQPAHIEHVGLYLGDGRMVHAPQTGQTVTITGNLWQPGGHWATRFVGAVRGLPADPPTPPPA